MRMSDMQTVDKSGKTRPRLVIVGAGFGGLSVARALPEAQFNVTIIDRQNHHLFQPLLYQVATGAVSPADVAVPIRSLFRDAGNIRVLMDEVIDVDVQDRVVVARAARYKYDYLVLATGSEYAYFGQNHWRTHSVSLKTLEDALIMRERILVAFERAEMEANEAERRRLMRFVVIGGGPTGVELAGAIAELAKSTLIRDFQHIASGEAEIVLLEAGPRLLSGFPPRLIDFAQRALERKGVTVRLETPVKDIQHDGVVAGRNDALIPAATVLWAAGTKAGALGDWLSTTVDPVGRVKIGSDLSVAEHPEIFVIGDAAHFAISGEMSLPGVAPVAKQQGTYVAKVLRGRIESGRAPKPFRYRDEGMLATIGRGAAVANLRWLKLTGWIAWMFWGLGLLYLWSWSPAHHGTPDSAVASRADR